MEQNITDMAQKVLKRLRERFEKDHVCQTADASCFPHLAKRFYKRTQTQLEKMGFHFIGDLENLTLKEQKPDPRTFIRVMADPAGEIVAAFYHVKPRFPWPLLMWLWGLRPARLLEFESEFSDGSMLMSTLITPKADVPPPPKFIRIHYPRKMPVDLLLKNHQAKLQEKLRVDPDVKPVRIRTLQDVIKMQNRQLILTREHLEEIGWVTREYLYKHGARKEFADQIYAEIQRLLKKELITGKRF
jgi:hypothetical protein